MKTKTQSRWIFGLLACMAVLASCEKEAPEPGKAPQTKNDGEWEIVQTYSSGDNIISGIAFDSGWELRVGVPQNAHVYWIWHSIDLTGQTVSYRGGGNPIPIYSGEVQISVSLTGYSSGEFSPNITEWETERDSYGRLRYTGFLRLPYRNLRDEGGQIYNLNGMKAFKIKSRYGGYFN